MADSLLVSLPLAGPITGTDLFYAVQGTLDVKVPASALMSTATIAPLSLDTQVLYNRGGVVDGADGLTYDFNTNTTTAMYEVISGPGAASLPAFRITGTPFSGGTSTTTKPLFLMETPALSTTSAGWSTTGTMLGINTPGTGIALAVATLGVVKFSLDAGGNISAGNYTTSGTISGSNVTASSVLTGSFLTVSSTGANITTAANVLVSNTNANTQFFGSTTNSFRLAVASSNGQNVATNSAYSQFIVGIVPLGYAAGAATIPMAANAVFNSLGAVTLNGNTLTNSASVYVGPPTAGAVNNYSAYINGSIFSPVVSKTASYTVTSADATILVDATAGAVVITVPQLVGAEFQIKKIDATANTVTVTPASGLIDGAATKVLSSANSSVRIKSNGTNTYILGVV